MTDFEIPLVLEEMIHDGSLIHKHLPKQADIDKILTQINRKYLRRMHLPCSLKDMHFCDTYNAIMFNRYPKHRKAMEKLQQAILSQYMVQGGLLYIYVMQQQDGLPFHELLELVSLQVTILDSSIGHVVRAG